MHFATSSSFPIVFLWLTLGFLFEELIFFVDELKLLNCNEAKWCRCLNMMINKEETKRVRIYIKRKQLL